MDLIDRLNQIGERVLKLKEQVGTEEATKNAFVMPFIAALGYDVFNPMEVIPEYTADVGIKKGEKVDYCITKEESPIIIMECKHWKEKLKNHNSQLHRYFHATKVRFAILTNGITYRFFTDLEASNKMDEHPFLEFDITQINEHLINELKRFQKNNFDEEAILEVANDLKYSKQIKELLSKELKSPSEDFIKYFASRVYQGRVTSKILDQFGGLVRKSAKSLLSEMINERLQLAISKEEPEPKEEPISEDSEQVAESEIETTEEELQGFRIVQAILSQSVSTDRIVYKDTRNYFSILFLTKDEKRKLICRLWFNRKQKYLGLFNGSKKEQRNKLEKLEDIHDYSEQLKTALAKYQENEN